MGQIYDAGFEHIFILFLSSSSSAISMGQLEGLALKGQGQTLAALRCWVWRTLETGVRVQRPPIRAQVGRVLRPTKDARLGETHIYMCFAA